MENIWLGREPLRGKVGLVDHKKMYSDTVRLLKELELDLDPKEKMRNLTVAQMQMVEIVYQCCITKDNFCLMEYH